MKSWELLRELFARQGIKQIAARLGRSRWLVHKWTEPAGGTGSGLRNPLDVLALLMQGTDARRLAQWVCAQAGGRFVPDPPVTPCSATERQACVGRGLQALWQMTAALAGQVSHPRQSEGEMKRLQALWAELQADMEQLLASGGPNAKRAEEAWPAESHRCRHRRPGGRCGFHERA